MFFHTVTLAITTYFLLVTQPSQPIEFIPVDAGVEDRGVLGESLLSSPVDLRQDQSFEKLYKVKGNDDVYVRKAGGLRAVFRSSHYIDSADGSIAIVPAGTVYCIGEVRPELLRQLGVLVNPEVVVSAQEVIAQKPQRMTSLPHTSVTREQSIRFFDDEAYRRERLTLFVLEMVLSK